MSYLAFDLAFKLVLRQNRNNWFFNKVDLCGLSGFSLQGKQIIIIVIMKTLV